MNRITIFILLLLGMYGCETASEGYMQDEPVAGVRAEFKYIANPNARYRVEFGGITLTDTLPNGSIYGSKTIYYKESKLAGILRIYRLGNGTETLDTETEYSVVPAHPQATINLFQLTGDSPVQVAKQENPPADSAAIAVRFFYADQRQAPGADKVTITILAADQYALLMTKPQHSLDKMEESLKTEVGELELTHGELSEAVELDVNFFGDVNKGLAARFFYKITDAATGAVIQDYKAGSPSGGNTAEIKIETVKKNNVPYPAYKSCIMQWTYTSEAMPFASPVALIKGEKW